MGGYFSALFSRLIGPKEVRILILGLDNAGKTTILYRLHLNEVVETLPTIGFNVETVRYKNVEFQVWDLGGQTSVRPYWRCYFPNTNAVIYVVDSADRERISDAKHELHLISVSCISAIRHFSTYASILCAPLLIEWCVPSKEETSVPGTRAMTLRLLTAAIAFVRFRQEEELRGVALAVVANKQDLPDAMSEGEISAALGLPALRDRPWAIMRTSAVKGEGLDRAMDWLTDVLSQS